MYKFILFILLVCPGYVIAQQPVDVQHYRFELELSDGSDAINGKAFITVQFLANLSQVKFDLASMEDQKGMYAFLVKEGAQVLIATQSNNVLTINLSKPAQKAEVHTFEIDYMGTTNDGLIISKNKYGDRTFFSDNWPNRAHNWIPCHDVPSDKASVEFIVTAPAQYRVISNGVQVEEKSVEGNKKRTYWKETTPIPTKVMVIGVAQFAVKRVDVSSAIPVTAWVYPQDSANGFYDYALAAEIVQFFAGYIGPYPYQKLANVQSKTIFGGMENASAIFYAENSVTGTRKSEDLLAHEIAHQWFGDMATEKNFTHLWLSEGFATYMTDIYLEQKYGTDSLSKRLQKERQQVVQFARTAANPVVDTVSDYMDLLNANSYQKGAWVLHMLRGEVGDSLFHKIIKTYYNQYKGSNADTRDFEKVAEDISGNDLKPFFDQWLYTPGIPQLKAEWKITTDGLIITMQQTGKTIFNVPVTIGYVTADGRLQSKKITVSKPSELFTIPVTDKPFTVQLDPLTALLFSGTISEAK